jgi:flavorubredoxin
MDSKGDPSGDPHGVRMSSHTNSISPSQDRVLPYEVAEETFVIPELHLIPGQPAVYINSLVIRGAEPVIVDTGNPLNRNEWWNAVFSIVDPQDVKWIYLSHDDIDHSGNLTQVMEACTNATVLTDWFMQERLAGAIPIPPERSRWLNVGDTIDAGDRTLVTFRPPMYDSPTTKGLYDSRTGLMWGVDSFAVPVFEPMEDVRDYDHEMWRMVMTSVNRAATPWLEYVDADKFRAHVGQSEALNPTVIASAHSPAIYGDMVADAFAAMHDLPVAEPFPFPGQADLDAMVAAQMAAAQPKAA